MSIWEQLLLVLVGAGVVWMAVRMFKSNRGNFTKVNFEKTAFTVGVLALIIIGVVALCVLMLRS